LTYAGISWEHTTRISFIHSPGSPAFPAAILQATALLGALMGGGSGRSSVDRGIAQLKASWLLLSLFAHLAVLHPHFCCSPALKVSRHTHVLP
jgi:hypothetical protein